MLCWRSRDTRFMWTWTDLVPKHCISSVVSKFAFWYRSKQSESFIWFNAACLNTGDTFPSSHKSFVQCKSYYLWPLNFKSYGLMESRKQSNKIELVLRLPNLSFGRIQRQHKWNLQEYAIQHEPYMLVEYALHIWFDFSIWERKHRGVLFSLERNERYKFKFGQSSAYFPKEKRLKTLTFCSGPRKNPDREKIRPGTDFSDQNPYNVPDQVRVRTKFRTTYRTGKNSDRKSGPRTGPTNLGPKIRTTVRSSMSLSIHPFRRVDD